MEILTYDRCPSIQCHSFEMVEKGVRKKNLASLRTLIISATIKAVKGERGLLLIQRDLKCQAG